MITKELVDYIRGEVGKGKTREEIQPVLISGGGWTDADLNEAFRTVVPAQNPISSPAPILNPIQPISAPSQIKPVQAPIQNPVSNPPKQINNMIMPKIQPATQMASPLSSPTISPLYSAPSLAKMNPYAAASKKHSSHGFLKFLMTLIILILIASVILYFFFPSLWNSIASDLHIPFPNQSAVNIAPIAPVIPTPVVNTPVAPVTPPPVVNTVADCGTAASPDLKTPSTYENNSTLSCLGTNILNCTNATGTLTDPLFPTSISITKDATSCSFTLAYSSDSTLVDITGKKLAGQSITCPVSIIKSVDQTNPNALTFNAPDTTDMGKYASQMYFYGTIGVFLENNLDPAKIASLGCSGDYINSVIASYNAKQTTK